MENTKKNSSRIYNSLSLVYDHLMENVDYDGWAEYILEVVEDYIPKNPSVLELSAGLGQIASYISEKYPDYIISDLSKNMLRRSDCVNKKGKILDKVVCNMTALPFKKSFDLIISTFDSINYLLSKEKLNLLFKEVRKILSEDGVFAFDVSLLTNSLPLIKPKTFRYSYKNFNYIQKTYFNLLTLIHTNEFIILDNSTKKEKKNNQIIGKEIHKQKIFPFETFFEIIEKNNLYVVHCYDAFTFKKGKASSKRVQFIVKKIK